ncbi:electron transporter [Sphingomonas sp. Leaf357]|uniref:SCO family protein n=1 Tax=Sphingomonas sp. Leaf357 TaxID=1736350 RepID=UPI0006FAD0E5|nr:SCO family protein [Sphingomonas sp. Leaf357]KQS03222.1 electron transporter [Sphingomonas sp. Leaf357]
MNQIVRLAAALSIACLPIACSSPSAPAASPPLEGARIGGPFALTDQDGKPATERTFAGRYAIMYFGYTFCPDVCPVDMQNIASGLRTFEKSDPQLATKVVPVFVSVDPARDTPAVLKQFVGNFHPRLVGLTGSDQAIAAIAKAYAVYYKKGDVSPDGGYMMDHSRVAYLMSPEGKPLALLPSEGTPQAIATELKRWVR